jgi:hypothetical protein
MCAYGVDVLDPAVSPRRLLVLLDRLPPWARTPGEHWSVESHLLALLVDHVAALTWVTMRAHGAKGATRPRPLPRPSHRVAKREPGPSGQAPRDPSGQAKAGSWADAAAMLAGVPGMRVSRGDLLLRRA